MNSTDRSEAGMLRFVATQVEIPRMAWVYSWSDAANHELLHGEGVEVFEDGFFEGCFAGDWQGRSFDTSANVFGSGMRIRDGNPLFVPPSHNIESLYVFHDGVRHAVSNSLALLFARFDLSLPYLPDIGSRFASSVRGIERYERELIRTSRFTISRVVYDNFRVEASGEIRHSRKIDELRFQDFETYRAELRGVLDSAFQNAADVGRRATFTPLTTCSSGYDSVAVAALAVSVGCREAVTLRHARGGVVDSGRPVAEVLGLRITEVDRVEEGGEHPALPEFLAAGMGGEDVCYAEFADLLEGRILLTGFHGGKIWDRHAAPNTVLKRGDISGSSLQEFRLRTGFIHLPVPMIAARHFPTVQEISNSAEMRPYQLDNKYDRPIPRRIAEEMGVPREMFGQSKKGASVQVFWGPARLGAAARPGLEQAHRRVCGSPWLKASYALRTLGWELRFGLRGFVGRRPGLVGLREWIVPEWAIFEHNRPSNLVLLEYALTRVAPTYAKAIPEQPTRIPMARSGATAKRG